VRSAGSVAKTNGGCWVEQPFKLQGNPRGIALRQCLPFRLLSRIIDLRLPILLKLRSLCLCKNRVPLISRVSQDLLDLGFLLLRQIQRRKDILPSSLLS
jgi:hypothetical protein